MAFFIFLDFLISWIFMIVYAVKGVFPVWLAVVLSIVYLLIFFIYVGAKDDSKE